MTGNITHVAVSHFVSFFWWSRSTQSLMRVKSGVDRRRMQPLILSKLSHTWPATLHAWTYIYVVHGSMMMIIVQELCESRGGRPGLSVLTSLLVSVNVKLYWTMLRHWSQLVRNLSTDISVRTLSITSSSFPWWWWSRASLSLVVGWHIRDKLWPMPKHRSMLLLRPQKP